MTKFYKAKAKAIMSVCGGSFIALTLAGCTTAGERDYADPRRCKGSRQHDECVNRHQYHRDHEQLMNTEKARINAEQARENLRMLREIRRKRGEY